MIDLCTAGMSNGYTVSIMLEECRLDFMFHHIDFGKLEQKEPAFLSINPSGRIPAIIDHPAGGRAIYESGAILIYLAQRTGRFLPVARDARFSVL